MVLKKDTKEWEDKQQLGMEDVAQQVHDENATTDQFAVSQTPYHTHNKADSPGVSYQDLNDRDVLIPVTLMGTSAATAGNYGVIFTAPFICSLFAVNEVHAVKGTDASAVTVQIEKLTGTTASGSGTTLLVTGFNMKGNINTVQYATLKQIPRKSFSLARGDRLGLVLSGTPTSIAQAVFTIALRH